MAHTLSILEVDFPRCSLTYGVAPCTAAIGVTGSQPCFNTPGSCQAPTAYTEAATPLTISWCTNSERAPVDRRNLIPAIEDVGVRPQKIEPGESLGRRERATVRVRNHPHNDVGLDPYPESRPYNPWNQGTLLGRLAARYPNMQGYPARLYRGVLPETGDPRTGMELSHYEIDRFDIDVDTGEIQLVDGLAWLEPTQSKIKALYPRPNNGRLTVDINNVVTGLTLEPPGIGDLEYPSSGYAAIDKEVVQFTRTGDTMLLVARGLFGSEAKTHRANAAVQVVGTLQGNVAQIFNQLLQATDTPAAYYNMAAWTAEAELYAPEILRARIAQPTPVNELVNRLMREMGLDIHTDVRTRQFVLRVLRPLGPVARISEGNGIRMSPGRDGTQRVDTVFIRFGRENPVEKYDEDSNYIGNLYVVDDNPYQAIQQNPLAIQRINSIFIPPELQQTARDTARIILGRYNRVLRTMRCATLHEYAPEVGEIVAVSSRFFEDVSGARDADIPMQVVATDRGEHQVNLELVEYRVDLARAGNVRRLSILVDKFNVNLRALYNEWFGTAPIPAGTQVIFEGDGEHGFGGNVLGAPSLEILAEDWPEVFSDGVSIELRNLEVLGRGGRGGQNLTSPNGENGSMALYTRVPVLITNSLIGGGGGGGGGEYFAGPGQTQFFQGAGGAGLTAGGGIPAGGRYEGGSSNVSGDGGDLGQPGLTGTGGPTTKYSPGAAGVAVDGISYVTIAGSTTILGPTVN